MFSGVNEYQWYSDAIIRRLDVTKAMVFEVFDWNAVLSHRKIGKAKLELSDVPSNGQHYELKLDENEGVLNVFVKILWPQVEESIAETPVFPQQLGKTVKLPTLRMHLERTNYHPGEVIRGHIILILKKATKMAEISIEAWMKVNMSSDIIVPASYTSYFYNFYDKVTIGDPHVPYEAGPHVFAFQFLLPEHCVTHSLSHCVIRATLRKKSSGTFAAPVQRVMVTPPYDLLSPRVCPFGLPHDSCPEPLQGIVATFNPAAPKLIYPNKPFYLDVTLLNDSNATLSKFRVDIVVIRIGHCYQEKKNKWHSTKVLFRPASLELSSKLRLEPGQSLPIQAQINFGVGFDTGICSIPPEMQPQTIQVFHHLVISAKHKTTDKRVVCLRHPVFVLDQRMFREGGLDSHMPDLESAKIKVTQVPDLPTRLSLMAPSMNIGTFSYRYVPGFTTQYLNCFEDVLIGDSLSDQSFYELPTLSNLKKIPPSELPSITSAIPDAQAALKYPRDLLH